MWSDRVPESDDRPPRISVDIDRAEAMRLVASAPFGRIVFTRDALPAIRPVNHLVIDGSSIVVRTALGSGLAGSVRADRSVVVAYEVDDIDPIDRLGWSVVVTGLARPVTDPELIAEYTRRLRPWVDHAMDRVITIEPTLVTGVELIAPPTEVHERLSTSMRT
ncbi:pyridoxamine 5'-phosphate oxidase family protein [Nocardia abscessus]|uniref:pyridoxamine 5'-phosphate oxidase family protein n=1 Tax=Nocardia abscessus TaxID=120957 RepID=UPI002455299A|nr:pyridoxamine 5'-phosphate oxidase family protein [Nocardia abscessus]